jgi:hypothetical protein
VSQNKPESVALQVAKLSRQEHIAIKTLAQGEATADQQLLALEVIVKKFARAFDLAYIPGTFDETAFLAGRGFVGQQITKFVNTPVPEK